MSRGVSWPSGLHVVHWTQVLVLSEMWVRILAWPVAALLSLSKTLNHNCFVLRMGHKAVGREREGGLPRCFWIHALSTQQCGYVRAINLLYYYYYYYDCFLLVLLKVVKISQNQSKFSLCAHLGQQSKQAVDWF